MTTPPAPVVPAVNGALLRVIPEEDATIIEAADGTGCAGVILDAAAHHRLAADLAHHLGYLPVSKEVEIAAWTVATPMGLWVATQRSNGSWWAVSTEEGWYQTVLHEPERLWPLVRGTEKHRGTPGAYHHDLGDETALAHCLTGRIHTSENTNWKSMDEIDGELYRLQLPMLYRVNPREIPERIDVATVAGHLAVLRQGVVISDDENLRSCVLDEDGYGELLHALADTLPVPRWIQR